ncbi:MAG: hypothetical protein AAGI17_07405 [Planctomycetota bacterium]
MPRQMNTLVPVFAGLIAAAGTATGQTLIVSNTSDGPVAAAGDLPGSLQQAIFDANAKPSADFIEFDPSPGPTVDFNGGGVVNISDLLAFVTAFTGN